MHACIPPAFADIQRRALQSKSDLRAGEVVAHLTARGRRHDPLAHRLKGRAKPNFLLVAS